jgi:hypothetical protein
LDGQQDPAAFLHPCLLRLVRAAHSLVPALPPSGWPRPGFTGAQQGVASDVRLRVRPPDACEPCVSVDVRRSGHRCGDRVRRGVDADARSSRSRGEHVTRFVATLGKRRLGRPARNGSTLWRRHNPPVADHRVCPIARPWVRGVEHAPRPTPRQLHTHPIAGCWLEWSVRSICSSPTSGGTSSSSRRGY